VTDERSKEEKDNINFKWSNKLLVCKGLSRSRVKEQKVTSRQLSNKISMVSGGGDIGVLHRVSCVELIYVDKTAGEKMGTELRDSEELWFLRKRKNEKTPLVTLSHTSTVARTAPGLLRGEPKRGKRKNWRMVGTKKRGQIRLLNALCLRSPRRKAPREGQNITREEVRAAHVEESCLHIQKKLSCQDGRAMEIRGWSNRLFSYLMAIWGDGGSIRDGGQEKEESREDQ